MAGLFGWYENTKSAEPKEPSRILAKMCGNAAFDSEIRSGVAIAVSSPTGQGSIRCTDNLVAAIAGLPAWTDSELAAIAKSDGNAAALARAYSCDGLELFRHIRGAFTLTVIDQRSTRVVAAVDRMGIGRLYYACPRDGGIVFGTTADGVREFPSLPSTLSPQGIYDYLFFFMSPAPGTIYTEQKKLMGAQYLVFENQSVRTDFYWQMPYQEHNVDSPLALEAQLRRMLSEAVESAITKAGNCQIGAFLSGGLDSSTMVGLIEQANPGKVTCFTIGFDVEGFDEMPYAKLAAHHFNCRHHPHYMTSDDLIDAVNRVVAACDEPYGNSSAVPTYVCAKVAREKGIDTMIAGDGGDELFAGNERYVANRIFDYYDRLPKILRRGLIEPTVSLLGERLESDFLRRCGNFIQYAKFAKPERPFARNLYAESVATGVFDREFLKKVDTASPLREIKAIIDRAESAGGIQRMMHTDLQRTLSDNDLLKVRRMCESAGVDVVFPFLDDRIVEFAAGIPEKILLPGGELRGFYKSAFRDFLPRETIEKKKHGFSIPSLSWSRNVPVLRDLLLDKILSFGSRGVFQKSYLNAMTTSVIGNKDVTEMDVQLVRSAWDVMMLEQWLSSRKM